MKEWERKVCDEIAALGRVFDPRGESWWMFEIIFLEVLGGAMLLAWKHRNAPFFERHLDHCRGLTEGLAKCGDPSYDPEHEPDGRLVWRMWNPARLLRPLALSERARFIDLLGYVIHSLIDRLAGAWGDDGRFKAAVGDALEVGYRLHGLDFDPRVMDG